MPVLPTSPGDVTAVVRIAAQATPAGAKVPKASASGVKYTGGSVVGAVIRASASAKAASPSISVVTSKKDRK